MKTNFSTSVKEITEIDKRRDRFDAILCEYCRQYRKSREQLAEKVGCSTVSLWRYRTNTESFSKAPLDVICSCLKISNVSNHDLRYILGLPTGSDNDKN